MLVTVDRGVFEELLDELLEGVQSYDAHDRKLDDHHQLCADTEDRVSTLKAMLTPGPAEVDGE